MTPLATVLWAWVAVHLFAGFMSAFLYLRLRAREYLAFLGMCLSLAGLCAASALVADARQPADAAAGQTLRLFAAGLALAAYVVFAHVLLRRPGTVVVRRVLGATVVGSSLILSRMVVDPDAVFVPRLILSWAPPSQDLELSVPAVVGGVTVLVFGGWLAKLLWPLRRRTDVLLVLVALCLMLFGWTHDLALGLFHVRGLPLTEQLASVGGVVVSYLLLANFAETATALESKTQELRHAYDELRHVQEELVRKEQLAAVGELSAVIAHEVRNPLAVLRNAASGLRRERLAAEDRATLLTVLDEETDRLNRLVRDLLTYARPVQPQLSRLHLATVLESAIAKARPELVPESAVVVDLSATEGRVVEGDASLLECVFGNIIANALEAMPGGGTLTVRGEPGDLDGRPAVVIVFQDTGEGMDTLVRARARDPFFTTRPSGTGLGLAIVERIVKAHGGRLDLGSGEEGATVVVLLPARSLAEELNEVGPQVGEGAGDESEAG